MFDFVNFGAEKLQLFLLIILRISGLFFFAPVIGDKTLPMALKVGLAILLSGILVSTMGGTELPSVLSTVDLAALAFREILVGALIGFFFMLLFLGVQAGGSIVGYQIGLSIANVIDPSTESEQSIIGQFWFILAVLIFLCINGHHLIIQAFVDSYQVMPAGQASMGSGAGELMISYTAYVFVIALKLASPALVTLFLTDIALATVSKMMPTMNVFIVGFAVKIGAGIAVLGLSLPVFSYVLEKTSLYLNSELAVLLSALGKA
ncbi:MAG: flagellar biosynthetic protein FliR [candidate division Zixibacteria bacterium]|nr:flagellar biosynthetic protein FliR [candidate division Zixibacteria bacterium]